MENKCRPIEHTRIYGHKEKVVTSSGNLTLFQGDNSIKIAMFSPDKESILKKQRICFPWGILINEGIGSPWELFFHFRVDPLQKGHTCRCTEKLIGSHKSLNITKRAHIMLTLLNPSFI